MAADDGALAGDGITAPMPGLVTRLDAQPGQKVSRGERLIVLEAMKMEHPLCVSRDGVVAEVLAVQGEQVAQGALLLTLEPGDG